ncbi:hypothetical protein J2Y46_003375 [Microbacterium sp. BE35]|nr:hypothetical protein [Microbacterium sp. BE35]MDR7190526.1 hypothetical protein [Microbacterium sp. BE35]
MSAVVATMSLSLDGIGAGVNQTEERPVGEVPEGTLHRWMVLPAEAAASA